ncbi:MAG: hypothetical protein ACK4IT_03445 [Thioalkalivibrionaceae bacterium]
MMSSVLGRERFDLLGAVLSFGERGLPILVLASSGLVWILLPAEWAVSVVPLGAGAMLSIAGLYLFFIVQHLERLRPDTRKLAERSVNSPVSLPSEAGFRTVDRGGGLAQDRLTVVALSRRRRVAEGVTLLTVIGGPVLAVVLQSELAIRPNLAVGAVAWALCVGGLALSLVIGGYLRAALRDYVAVASGALGQAVVGPDIAHGTGVDMEPDAVASLSAPVVPAKSIDDDTGLSVEPSASPCVARVAKSSAERSLSR